MITKLPTWGQFSHCCASRGSPAHAGIDRTGSLLYLVGYPAPIRCAVPYGAWRPPLSGAALSGQTPARARSPQPGGHF
jgi:hypothetical protein